MKCALALLLSFALLAPCWGQSVVLSLEEVAEISSALRKSSEALKESSRIIAKQSRTIKMLSISCGALLIVAVTEGIILAIRK